MRWRVVIVTCDDCGAVSSIDVDALPAGVEVPVVPVGWTHDQSGKHRCSPCSDKHLGGLTPAAESYLEAINQFDSAWHIAQMRLIEAEARRR